MDHQASDRPGAAGYRSEAGQESGRTYRVTDNESAVGDPGQPALYDGKKRDDLQKVIALLEDGDFGLPRQFTNFRD